jgi:hypothetical protein
MAVPSSGGTCGIAVLYGMLIDCARKTGSAWGPPSTDIDAAPSVNDPNASMTFRINPPSFDIITRLAKLEDFLLSVIEKAPRSGVPLAKDIRVFNFPLNFEGIIASFYVSNIGTTEVHNEMIFGRVTRSNYSCAFVGNGFSNSLVVQKSGRDITDLKRWASPGVITNYRKANVLIWLQRSIKFNIIDSDIRTFADMERFRGIVRYLFGGIGAVSGSMNTDQGFGSSYSRQIGLDMCVTRIERQHEQRENGDKEGEPITSYTNGNRRFQYYVCGMVLGLLFAGLGMWFIQAAGAIEDINIVNLAKLGTGVILVLAAWMMIHAALDWLHYGQIYLEHLL